MLTAFRGWSLGCVISGLVLSAGSVQAQESEGVVRLGQRPSAGVVRISDRPQSSSTFRGQSPEGVELTSSEVAQLSHCESESDVASGPSYEYVECPQDVGLHWRIKSKIYNHLSYKGAWLRGVLSDGECKVGHCNKDEPGRPLFGHYNMVYPVDPGYFDQRDGQVYAAPGYGGPVSVPLAPVVNHTWNYGWGVPSSRLTPVLHPATRAPVMQYPSPYPSAPVSY